MIGCAGARDLLQLYLDRELAPGDELEFEAHLMVCGSCRDEYEKVREIVDTVRGARPLFEPSAGFRQTIGDMVRNAAGKQVRRFAIPAGIPATIAACLVLLATLLPLRSASFTAYAADTHLRFATGKLPLDIESDHALVVSAWLERHLRFALPLRGSPIEGNDPRPYTLEGARLVQFDGEDVAYLAYRMGGRPISLLVTSSRSIVPSGREVYRSGNLSFHFSERDGVKLITWQDRDLVYALASDLDVSPAQSCVVCHGSAAERSRFENLLR